MFCNAAVVIRVDTICVLHKQAVSGDRVEDFVDLYESGKRLPLIVVRKSKGCFILVDGRHRLAAHKQLGRNMIEARISL